ncbi:MAG TPA: hypothetical protein VGD10_13145 [Allosphingosinicella sp.]|uniref:hypothetical protein n=1 Tax=Allosphingosinicella sp. TaxID=2823234 RepID=UPI002ED82FBC
MILSTLAAIFLSTSTPAPVTIEVGRAQWDRFPSLEKRGRELPVSTMVGLVEEMLASKQCELEGQSAKRFDITVPYAVMLGPDGYAQRIVVADVGCAPLETMIGQAVYGLSSSGNFSKSGAKTGRWYVDEVSLILQ